MTKKMSAQNERFASHFVQSTSGTTAAITPKKGSAELNFIARNKGSGSRRCAKPLSS